VRSLIGSTIAPMAAPDDDQHAQFCRELATLRLLSGPRRAALEQAVRRLREGADFQDVVGDLGVDILAPPNPRTAGPTPVGAPGPPVRGSYICPVGACHRVEQRLAGQGAPECLVHERVLSFVPDA
jgi:hypothetical protein